MLLEDMADFAHRAVGDIACSLMPPDRIVCGMSGRSGFFALCAEKINSGMTVREAWGTAMDECPASGCLKPEERLLVEKTGGQLGVYDSRRQVADLERLGRELDIFRDRAETDLRENGRTGVTCTVLASALAALMII